jgi:hypothetical protein
VSRNLFCLNYLSTPQWVLSSSKGSNFIKVTKLTNIHGHVHENILYRREVDEKLKNPNRGSWLKAVVA